MRIKRIRILNYKGFKDSHFVAIGDKTTVIVGQNNSGKTAFLEAFGALQNRPYKSPPRGDGTLPVENPNSTVQLDIEVTGREVAYELLSSGQGALLHAPGTPQNFRPALEDFFANGKVVWEVQRVAAQWSARRELSDVLLGKGPTNYQFRIDPAADKQTWTMANQGQGHGDGTVVWIQGIYDRSTFVFRAERLNVGIAGINNSSELAPDASNLPSVLLQLRPAARERYISLVRDIFPNIWGVSSRPIDGQRAGIFVSNRDSRQPDREAVELALNDCGTGISQVLAILYVAVTADFPKVIVIDEPNSFLHPGAARKLLDVLQTFNHQYIVSTHSSDIVSVLNPEVINLISWTENESKVEALDHAKAEDQRRILQGLGVRLSDVFGADNVLWVEGATEELCFPLILRELKLLNPGTSVISLIATGDLEAKGVRSDLALQVYERLSRGTALVPPALAISLDREDRAQSEIDDAVRRSRGLIKYLPRRVYENYLIEADAIADVLKRRLDGEAITPETVLSWISRNSTERKYFSNQDWPSRTAENWQVLIDGPKFLHDLYAELSGATVEFRKTLDSPELTKWLLEHKKDALVEVMDYLRDIVSPGQK